MSRQDSSQPDASRTVWDPFHGTLPHGQDIVAKPARDKPVSPKVRTLFIAVWLLGFVLSFIGVGWPPLLFLGTPLFLIGMAGTILIDRLDPTLARRNWMYAELARRNGWAFRTVEPLRDEVVEPARKSSGGAGGMAAGLQAMAEASRDNGRGKPRPLTEREQQVATVYSTIPDLLRPNVGQPLPLLIEAMYWGDPADGIPFWLGLQRSSVNMTLAAKQLKTDARGNSGNAGEIFHLVLAYRLDRDTGIRARLLAESNLGDSWRDIRTESGDFNRAFSISVASQGGGDPQLALLRALTPAMQERLLDLSKRYRAQVLIDGPIVFFSGYEIVMTQDEAALAQHFVTVVDDFAEAATSFKRYVE